MAKSFRFRAKAAGKAEIVLDPDDRDLVARGQQVWVEIQFGRAIARVRWYDANTSQQVSRVLHTLVAERHLKKPGEEFTVVEARNGNKLDCRVSNLEWRKQADTNYKRLAETVS